MLKNLKVNDTEATFHFHIKSKKTNQKKIAEALALSRTAVCLAIKGEPRLAHTRLLIVDHINSIEK